MLRHVLFDLALFVDESDRENSQKRVLWLLEALTRCDQLYLRNNPDTPLIYKSGIKYKVPEQYESVSVPEVGTVRAFLKSKGAPKDVQAALDTLSQMTGGGEHFRDIPRIIENGGGDCDNVASWRCAELRELGVDVKPYITWRKRPDGGTTYHVIVLHADGSSEDPSLLLGMGGEERAADRAAEEEKLAERTADFVRGFGRGRRMTLLGGAPAATPFSAQGGLPGDFGQGLQYTIPFQTDDAYENWSPTRPQAYFANPKYQGGLISQSGPIFNTRIRDFDEDEDDMLGATLGQLKAWEREMRRTLKRAG